MALCPFAVQRPLGRETPPMTPTVTVVHSNAGSGDDLFNWWTDPDADGLFSHFQINLAGVIYQYGDTAREAYANVAANGYGVSIETANNPGHAAQPGFDTDRWAGPQLASLIKLLGWLSDTHPIPRQWCTDGRHGIGAHDEFAQWTTPGHECPGRSRAAQLRNEIIPALSSPTPAPTTDDVLEFIMAMDAKQLEDIMTMAVKNGVALALKGEGVSGVKDAAQGTRNAAEKIQKKLGA